MVCAIANRFKETRQRESRSVIINIIRHKTASNIIELYHLFEKGFKTKRTTKAETPSKVLKPNDYTCSAGGSFDSAGKEVTCEVYQMNLKNSELKWEEVSRMSEARCFMGAAVFHDSLVVAVGGNCKQRIPINQIIYSSAEQMATTF